MSLAALRQSVATACAPIFRGEIYDWAAQHVTLAPVLTIRGKFNVSHSRNLIGPFEALRDNAVREVSVLAPVRGGKTLIGEMWLPYIVTVDPGPVIWNFQKDESADNYAESRMWPTLLRCPPVAARLDGVHRDKKRTAEVILPNMSIHIQGPALSNLQSKSARYLINDEVWQYPDGRLAEAYGRVGDFVRMGIEKILNLSQGGTPKTEWHLTWMQSSRHVWTVPCCGCGVHFAPLWSHKDGDKMRGGMRWDEHRTPSGDWDVLKCLPSIRYECPHCGHRHLDGAAVKSAWNTGGTYQQTNHDSHPTRRGYAWTAVIDYPWRNLVEEYLTACNAKHLGSYGPLILFFQKRMAEFSSDEQILSQNTVAVSELLEAGKWDKEKFRFLTVDRQKHDLYWATVRAWSADGESVRLWFGRLHGAEEIEAKRKEFDIPSRRVLVDSGYESKDEGGVYHICGKYGYIATKGSGLTSFEQDKIVAGQIVKVKSHFAEARRASSGIAGVPDCPLIVYSSTEMKHRVRRLIERKLWKEPPAMSPMDREYHVQMNSEHWVLNNKLRPPRWEWQCPSANNHAFDCAGIQCLCATIIGILPDYEGKR